MDFELVVLKMGCIFAMAFLFGLERQLEHKPIGFGVYIFVACAACALTVASIQWSSTAAIMPLLGAIVSGFGFLGAGVLFRNTEGIAGVISASSLLTFAILGIIIGFGEFAIGLALYALMWIILVVNRLFAFQSFGLYQKSLVLRSRRFLTREDLRQLFGMEGLRGFTIEYDRDKTEFRCTATLTGRPDKLNALPPLLLANPDVLGFKIE